MKNSTPNPGRPRLSVVVNTLNEEANIEACLASVADAADEIVVVDMRSDDRTVEIARRFTDRVFEFERSGVVEPARQFALNRATGDWIFVLDADERATPALAKGLRRVIENAGDVAVFRVPRRNRIAGRWMRGTRLGLDVERHPRLFRKGAVRSPSRIHAMPEFLGPVGEWPLSDEARIEHYAYDDLSDFVDRLNLYTDHEADALARDGERFSLDRMLAAAREEVEGRYDPEADGVHSLALTGCMAFYRFLAWAKLWEKQGHPRATLPPDAAALVREALGLRQRLREPVGVLRGFYDDEGGWRWMSEEGALRVAAEAQPATLKFALTSAPADCYASLPFEVGVHVGLKRVGAVAFGAGDERQDLSLVVHEKGDAVVRFTSDQSFVPAEIGGGADGRRLSLRLSDLRIEYAPKLNPVADEPEPAPEPQAPAPRRSGYRLGLLIADSTPPEEWENGNAPLAFGYFASYLREHLPEWDVVFRKTPEELLAENVDVVGISASTEEFELAKRMAATIKGGADVPVLVAGQTFHAPPDVRELGFQITGVGVE